MTASGSVLATQEPGNVTGHVTSCYARLGDGSTPDVVATGRDAPPELIDVADTVTEMVKVKHVYDRGVRARRGIDF